MNNQSNIQTKFRPSLTLEEINTIISLLNPTLHKEIYKKLHTFTLKASIGITSPSHVTIPKQSLEDSLGFGTPSTNQTNSQSNNATAEQLYTIWQTSPSSLSQSQLAQVSHYRYINDMMTPEEEHEYESKSGT